MKDLTKGKGSENGKGKNMREEIRRREKNWLNGANLVMRRPKFNAKMAGRYYEDQLKV